MAMRNTRRSGRSSNKKKEDGQESRETSTTPVDEDSNDAKSIEESCSRQLSEEVDANSKEDESSDESDESSDDEDKVPVTLMVNQRMKRATAGNKMAALLSTADQEDEFYKTAYGGFEENNDVDREYESSVHSEDEVDSDFDKPEEEDEVVSGGENDEEGRRKRKKFKEPRRGLTADDVLAKNKKWAMARLAGNIVEANAVDEKTQAQLLKEAEKTEKINIESLKKYEEFELEKKKKRERATIRVFPPGPREQIKMTKEGTSVTIPEIKKFQCDRPKPRSVCAVTGRPARYFDPITKLPYSTAYAFKVIRDKYNKYLRTIDGNQEVSDYLSRLKQVATPNDSPVPISLNPSSMVAE